MRIIIKLGNFLELYKYYYKVKYLYNGGNNAK